MPSVHLNNYQKSSAVSAEGYSFLVFNLLKVNRGNVHVTAAAGVFFYNRKWIASFFAHPLIVSEGAVVDKLFYIDDFLFQFIRFVAAVEHLVEPVKANQHVNV